MLISNRNEQQYSDGNSVGMKTPTNEELERSYEAVRVLIAEDEPLAAKLARGALRLMGITQVVVAEDGLDAMKQLADHNGDFQLIISDWNMPNMTGIEFLRTVRKIYPTMPFIMLTSNANKEFVLAAAKHGVNGYIAKPFSLDQMRQKVEAVFRI
jgi:two-component system, chemotaxis family, chemotaxis protein CheY